MREFFNNDGQPFPPLTHPLVLWPVEQAFCAKEGHCGEKLRTARCVYRRTGGVHLLGPPPADKAPPRSCAAPRRRFFGTAGRVSGRTNVGTQKGPPSCGGSPPSFPSAQRMNYFFGWPVTPRRPLLGVCLSLCLHEGSGQRPRKCLPA